jgi:arylsulfatase A-like enzyme
VRRSSWRPAAATGLVLATALGLACERPVPRAEIPARLAALERPNVLLVLVDTLRADWTTPYAAEAETTPALAQLAARGVVFERVHAQSSWTKISVASLMTSLWPRTLGIHAADDGLADSALPLAEVFREAGYRTYAVQTNGWLDQSFGFHQGFDRYMFPRGAGAARGLELPSVWPHAERVYREAQRLLDAHDPAEPFFLYLHFMDVHEYGAPPDFKTFGKDAAGTYRAAIRWVDHVFGLVLDAFDDRGLLDHTIVVFGSDHGETFGEHGVHGHARDVLTSVLHVPLVIRLPFPVDGVRVETQVRNLDLAPTLLELAGLPVPDTFEGDSLVGLLTSATAEPDRPVFAGLGTPLFPDAAVQVSVRDATWTFARNLDPESRRGELLFDRRVDPGENVNLVELEPGQAVALRARLDAYLEEQPAVDVLEQGVRIDPAIAERLRAMGYLR